MFSFLNRKDPKKSTAEKETEGFVIVGETAVEQTHRVQATNIAQPSTNVIVQSAKLPCVTPACKAQPALPAVVPAQGSPAGHAAVPLSDLLCDIPFTLAPHVLAMQSGFSFIPDVLLSRDINYNLATFHYDFTLENSVLCNM